MKKLNAKAVDGNIVSKKEALKSKCGKHKQEMTKESLDAKAKISQQEDRSWLLG